MLHNLLLGKLTNLDIDFKKMIRGKMTITFAYDLEKIV
jgi:hypothetical protein